MVIVLFLERCDMTKQCFFGYLTVSLILVLGGCSSWFFPDFDEGNDIVVSDGGKVEVRKVEEKGVLVGDKANALYEGEQDKDMSDGDDSSVELSTEDAEKVVAAEVVAVSRGDIEETNPKNDLPQENVDAPKMRYLAGVVYFANGGSNIDGEGWSKLKKIAKTAKDNKALVEVFGFASSRTRNTDPVTHKLANFKISAQRADNAAAVLRQMGVKSDNIVVQALSDTVPMYKEVMPEGERLNRRVEIYLTY